MCPKCTNAMRQYERNDVIIDQCTECGGIFLDRGELERLAQAEANYYNPQAAMPLPPRDQQVQQRFDERQYDDPRRDERRYDEPRYDERRYDDRRRDERYYKHSSDRGYDPRYERGYKHDSNAGYDPRYSGGKYGKRRKREGFFGDMMDMFGD